MSALFSSADGTWRAERLLAQRSVLRFAPLQLQAPGTQPLHPGEAAVELLSFDNGAAWALVAGEEGAVHHNGQPLRAGLRVLAHGDLLELAGESVFFSTERTACIEPFAGAAPVQCPRCKREISPGEPAVCCPGCKVVHHESSIFNCWSHADCCAVCATSTALEAGLQWTPEAL